MKKTPVVIKGNKSGIRIILDSELSFEELLEEVEKKFTDSADFLGDARVAVSLEGRDLSEEEEAVLLQCISDHSQLHVVCLIDHDKMQEEYFTQTLNDRLMQMNANTGQFFKGNLRSGQVMEFETSIVILGDVNAGAQVVSTGNVIILGALNGTVYAGASGRENCFVVALKMNPVQIRIGDVIARCADEKNAPPKEPQIAYLEEDTIYVDTISRQTLSDIKC
ncbi:MAG: septum site-determining protein MinC [Eubacterium sp.]|jgi:Septum formation inhibitor|nr:septum site-determining protein MinC [Eubacterium sp.]